MSQALIPNHVEHSTFAVRQRLNGLVKSRPVFQIGWFFGLPVQRPTCVVGRCSVAVRMVVLALSKWTKMPSSQID